MEAKRGVLEQEFRFGLTCTASAKSEYCMTVNSKGLLHVTNVELLVLGPPELHVRGRRVDLGPKRMAVLAYLALNGTTRRRALAELLWPDSDNPLNNLAVARNDLSRLLGPNGLLVTAQTIGLGPSVELDLHTWQDARTSNQQRWALFRGDFLHGLRIQDWANGFGGEFEQWLHETRECLASEHSDLALELGLQHLRDAQYNESIAYLQVAAQGEEPREDASRWYILALGAIGQQQQALRAFATLQEKLRDELEVDPSDASRQALEVSRDTPEACQDQIKLELQSKAPTTPSNSQRTAPVSAIIAPFVGRELELRTLKAHLEQQTFERTLILRGESGVGKSRLAQALLEQLPDHVLRFEFNPGQVPHIAIERLVRQLVNAQAEQVGQLPALWRVALSRFVPDLLPDETPPSEPELERMAAYRAIQQLIEPLGPVVVLLEDLQWADPPSLELIGHLRNNPPPGGLRQIVTWRDTETPSAPDATAQAVHTWIRAGAFDVGLTGLDETAIAELTRWFNRPEVNPHELRAHTAGNPLYITEWLRSDQPQGGLALNQLIYQRINQLGSEAQQILEALAVLGPNSNLGVLQRTSGRSLEQCIQALETTRQANLIQHDDTGIRFLHVLTFDVIQSHLNPARRDLLHLRAAHATQGTPLVCAGHYWQAQGVLSEEDHPKALQSFLEAGVQLGLRGEIAEASTWYERARSQAQTPDERVRVMVTQARTLEQFARYDEANQLLERIWDMLDLVDPVVAATANNVRSDLTIDRYGDVKTGFKYASAAYVLLEGVSSVAAQLERGRAKHLLGWCAFRNRNYEEAEQHFKTAMALHDSLGNQADRSSSMIAYGLIQMYLKKDGVKEILEEAALLALRSNYLTAYGYALNYLGNYFRRNKDWDHAVKAFEKAILTRSLIGGDFVLGGWLSNLAFVYFEQNDFQKARNHYLEALNARDVRENTHYSRVVILGNLAEVNIRLRLWSEARLVLQEAISLADEQSVPTILSDLYYWLAELEVLEGNLLAAQTGYQISSRIAQGNEHSERYALASAKLARLSGDLQLAQTALSTIDLPEVKASLLFVAGDYITAHEVMSGSHDPYERLRLDLDIAHATNDQLLREQTLALLPL
jgi:DNA-binding SARP family transcriptional activator/tetratricopeptide (TPR) repeat protein